MFRSAAHADLRRTPRQPYRTRRRAGLTLTETLVTLSIGLVALGAAVPGFEGARERRHVEGAAALFETDFAYARSSAVATNQTLRLRFGGDATGSCYVVFAGSPTQCTCSAAGPVCSGGIEPLRHVHQAADSGVAIEANVATLSLDPLRGTVTPTATVRFTARDGRALHQVVNLMGRVRSCSPAAALPGYPRC